MHENLVNERRFDGVNSDPRGFRHTPNSVAHTRIQTHTEFSHRGVPMGGSLVAAPQGKSPVFLVAASMDPLGANLDRIQIVKGWRRDEGEVKEKVYDVVWSGNRKPDGKGVLPAVGNTVDVSAATFSNSIGSPQLIEVWEDPDFDPTEHAFYYARVLQIPTPRWTLYDIVRYDIRDAPAKIPLTTQERAYTSAIWYTP